MRQCPKNTVLGFILVGLCLMAFGWMVEMLYLTNLGIDIAGQDAVRVFEGIQRIRSITAILYVFGLISISIGCVRLLRLPLGKLEAGE